MTYIIMVVPGDDGELRGAPAGPLMPREGVTAAPGGRRRGRDVTRQALAAISLSLNTPLHRAVPRKNIAKPCKN